MLTGAGLCEQPALAHSPREQRLTNGIVDLVRAGVVGVFALHQQRAGETSAGNVRSDRAATAARRNRAARRRTRSKTPGRQRPRHGVLELVERRDQHFGNEASAKAAEVTARVGLLPARERRQRRPASSPIFSAVGLDAVANVDAERMQARHALIDVLAASGRPRSRHGAPGDRGDALPLERPPVPPANPSCRESKSAARRERAQRASATRPSRRRRGSS